MCAREKKICTRQDVFLLARLLTKIWRHGSGAAPLSTVASYWPVKKTWPARLVESRLWHIVDAVLCFYRSVCRSQCWWLGSKLRDALWRHNWTNTWLNSCHLTRPLVTFCGALLVLLSRKFSIYTCLPKQNNKYRWDLPINDLYFTKKKCKKKFFNHCFSELRIWSANVVFLILCVLMSQTVLLQISQLVGIWQQVSGSQAHTGPVPVAPVQWRVVQHSLESDWTGPSFLLERVSLN